MATSGTPTDALTQADVDSLLTTAELLELQTATTSTAVAANNAVITIRRGTRTRFEGIACQIVPPLIEEISADGGQVRYKVTVPGGLAVKEAVDQLVVTDFPGNANLVSDRGLSIGDVRHGGLPSPATYFRAALKSQP